MNNIETIADIVRELRGPYYKMGRSNARLDHDMMGHMSFIANRIEAAHRREILVERKLADDHLVAKDAETERLRRRLKVAEDALVELQDRLVASVHDGTIDPHEALKIAEPALAAIREKGETK